MPTTVPARTKIAVVGHDNIVNEIIYFDHTFKLERPNAKYLHHGPDINTFVEVGWRYVEHVHPTQQWVPPEKKVGA